MILHMVLWIVAVWFLGNMALNGIGAIYAEIDESPNSNLGGLGLVICVIVIVLVVAS